MVTLVPRLVVSRLDVASTDCCLLTSERSVLGGHRMKDGVLRSRKGT
jgi:hypothetical protein